MCGNILAVSRDGLIALFDVATGTLVQYLVVPSWDANHGCIQLELTDWMLLAASGAEGGGVALYDLRNVLGSRAGGTGEASEQLSVTRCLDPHDKRMQVSSLCIARQSREVLAGSWRGRCCLWSLEDR